MNERYLFRGKRVDSHEWIEGHLSKGRLLGYEGNSLQPCIDREVGGVMITSVVDPATVGQCTGLRDKDGALVFEGDILQENRDPVPFIYQVGWFAGNMVLFVRDNINGDIRPSCSNHMVPYCGIIGNFHENPELMKGGEDA